MKKIFFILIFAITITLFGQSDSTYTLEDYLTLFFPENSFTEEDDIFITQIEELLKNPIEINKADFSGLSQIPFLSKQQVDLILDYRNKNGIFFSKFELLNIDGIDYLSAKSILPLIKVNTEMPSKNERNRDDFFKNYKVNLRSRVLNKNQSILKDFFSTENKYYNRFLAEINNYRIGFTSEKDYYERNQVDFYSFYFQSRDILLDKILIGDYQVYFGNGLAIWNPYRIYKPAINVTNSIRSRNSVLPYQSTDENKFLRGIAVEEKFSNFKMILFYSKNLIDGRYDSIANKIRLDTDGLHINENDIITKNNLSTITFGSSLEINFLSNIKLGFLIYQNSIRYKSKEEKENIFSTSYDINFQNLVISGENAFMNGNLKIINSLNFPISKNLSLIFSYRNYSPKAKSYWGNGFGESSNHSGEIGFFTGLDWSTIYGDFSLYFDEFKIVKNDLIDFEMTGNEFMVNYSKRVTDKTQLSIKLFYSQSESYPTNSNTKIIESSSRFRFDLTNYITKNILNKSRFEFSNNKNQGNNYDGFLIFDEIRAKLFSEKLSLSLRLTLFKTDNYDSRIYSFENDLPGLITVLPFYDDGYKWYLIFSYSPIKTLSFHLKYSNMKKYSHEKSSNNSIKNISGFNLQIDYNI